MVSSFILSNLRFLILDAVLIFNLGFCRYDAFFLSMLATSVYPLPSFIFCIFSFAIRVRVYFIITVLMCFHMNFFGFFLLCFNNLIMLKSVPFGLR